MEEHEDHKVMETKAFEAVQNVRLQHKRIMPYCRTFKTETTEEDLKRIQAYAIRKVRTYSGVELKGKELGQQLGVRWLK